MPDYSDPEELETALRHFIADASGLDRNRVIPGNTTSPRPRGEYATLLLTNQGRQAYPAWEDDGMGNQNATHYRRDVFSVQFYRKGARARALAFDMFRTSEPGQTRMETEGWAIIDAELDLRRLDEIVSSDLEERVQTDFTVDYTIGHTDTTTDIVERVVVDVRYNDEELDITQSLSTAPVSPC